MKTNFFRSIILGLALFLIGCSSDDSGSSECQELTCFNGGEFQDCGCNCPEGFTGTTCEIPKTPSKVIITNIKVKFFPNQNQGANWDPVSLPDIYVNIETISEIVYSSTNYYPDALSDGINNFDFLINPGYSITDISSPHFISVIDYDLEDLPPSEDDLMAFVAFYPYESSGGFPHTITISNPTSQFIVELSLNYQW